MNTETIRPALTYREVARALKVTERTVYRWVHEGQLQGIKIGRSVRVPADEMDRVLGRKTAPTDAA